MPSYQQAQETLSGVRFHVTYRLQGNPAEALDNAKSICVEETIEFPPELLPEGDYWEQVKGQVEDLEPAGENETLATLSYAIETLSPDLLQLLNVVYGNISMIPGIRVMDVQLPEEILAFFKGPRFGLDGIRELLGVYDRAMLCATLKPMGLALDSFTEMAYESAVGGVDFVKDDHGLSDQGFARFKTRVSRIAEAVQEGNNKSGGHCLYTPNITAPADQIMDRAYYAKETGAGAYLIIPALVGWDTVRLLRENDELGLPIICHPSFGGVYTLNQNGGMAANIYYGLLPRLAGGDATIFPNFVGRLFSTKQDCLDVLATAGEELGELKPIVPAPGGGVTLKTVEEMKDFYKKDVMYIMGGGLHRGHKFLDNCRQFIDLVT